MPDGMPNETNPETPRTSPAKAPLPELTLGRSRATPRSSTAPSSTQRRGDDDLEVSAANCRAKAEAARWAAERQRRIRERAEDPDEGGPADPGLREWADRLTDAYYWSSAGDASSSLDLSSLDDVGGCFETLAEAFGLLRATEHRPSGLEKALPLVAEAQSALRRSLQRVGIENDADQQAAYESVRVAAARHRLFLKRFLRADDLADPVAWPELLARIEARSGSGAPSQRQQALLDDLRSACASLRTDPGDESWRAIITALDRLVTEGTPPSSRAIREAVLPILDDLPATGDSSPGFRLVLGEIDRFLATRSVGAVGAAVPEPTAEVRRAAEMLAGRSVVLIGGIRRPQAQAVLRSTLRLEELVWIGTREHQSIRGFEAAIARPDVVVVLLAIRWSSHAFGDVKQYCDRYGKPLVRLPGGYNPAQVASQILAQCSGQLEG